jgi:hypothetical protein
MKQSIVNTTKIAGVLLGIAFVSIFSESRAIAFVENVNHGYPNCMSCHISPSGGGILTDYGRSLSKELMSTFGTESSTKPLFGILPESEAWKVGGDIRLIQTHFENDAVRRGEFFAMQENAEFAWVHDAVTVVSAIGAQAGPNGVPNKGKFISERHYVLVNVAESSFLRAGKFRIPFGINDPNHNRVTKSKLGFRPYSDTYNAELVHFTDNFEFFLGGDFGRFDGTSKDLDEKGAYGNVSWYMNDKSRVGAQTFFGRTDQSSRSIFGFNGIVSLPLHSIVVFETDWQKQHESNPKKGDKTSSVSTLRWNFVAAKGITPYLVTEYSRPDIEKKDVEESRNGLGIQWMPFPHFDVQAEYQKIAVKMPGASLADSAWLLMHFYF